MLSSSVDLAGVQLVVSSPLTRALHSALLAFSGRPADSKFIVHYFIRELGSAIPENRPRPIEHVLTDLSGEQNVVRLDEVSRVSHPLFEELAAHFPVSWAKQHSERRIGAHSP